MARNPNRGGIYRRCSCRDAAGAQLGARCPSLTNRGHGRWGFAVDLPAVAGRRVTMRRCGFPSRGAARDALHRVLDSSRPGSTSTTAKPSPSTSTAGSSAKHGEANHTGPLQRLCPQRPHPGAGHAATGGAVPSAHRAVHPRAARGRARPGHSAPLRDYPVQRADRRRAPSPAGPQPGPPRQPVATTARGTDLLVTRAGRHVPAPLRLSRSPRAVVEKYRLPNTYRAR